MHPGPHIRIVIFGLCWAKCRFHILGIVKTAAVITGLCKRERKARTNSPLQLTELWTKALSFQWMFTQAVPNLQHALSHKPKLREYQQKNCPGTLAAAKMKKKSKTGRTPKAITSGDCLSEDVPKDYAVRVPPCADDIVLPDGVTSPGASLSTKESPQLTENKRSCQQPAPRAAPFQEEPQTETLSSGAKDYCKCGESHQSLQEFMEKLKSRFLQAMEEKAALQERVDALEDRCLQLAAETETIGDFIVLYQRQRAMLKERYKEKDEYIHQLLQEKENLKVKLLELQRLVSQLTGKESEDLTTFLATAQSPAELVPGLPASQGFSTADQLGDCRKVSLADSVQPGQGKAGMRSPAVNPTTRPITQQKWKIQNTQELTDLGSYPCLPFFYWAGGNSQVKILVV